MPKWQAFHCHCSAQEMFSKDQTPTCMRHSLYIFCLWRSDWQSFPYIFHQIQIWPSNALLSECTQCHLFTLWAWYGWIAVNTLNSWISMVSLQKTLVITYDPHFQQSNTLSQHFLNAIVHWIWIYQNIFFFLEVTTIWHWLWWTTACSCP